MELKLHMVEMATPFQTIQTLAVIVINKKTPVADLCATSNMNTDVI